MDTPSETLVSIEEQSQKSMEKLEANFSSIGTKIHRFPRGLRCVSRDGRYIEPSFASFGPYHHGSPQVQEVEEVKHVAAHYLCLKSGHSFEEVYSKIASISGEARSCYADGDAAVARFNDVELANMMFLDGCFLLWYLLDEKEPALLLNRMILSTGPCMLRDIFLLENQLPWLVLEALMTFISVPIYKFILNRSSNFDASSNLRLSKEEFHRYKPPHLLGLFRYYHIGAMPPEDHSYKSRCFELSTSAIELAEIGIKVTASNKRWFADMSIQKGSLTGKLLLTPLFLDDPTACWLVNMAAFEACTSVAYPCDGYTICSYLSLLAMLMCNVEDVQKLRAKHLLRSFFSDQEMLDFFKGLACHLKLGHRYKVTLGKIDDYKRERRVRIAVHKFLYRNFKTIAALLSIVGVLVGIFKTLLSLKQH
ncbi:uncharacterized protein LOC112271436 [Brachypodium distachyon]|uniref:Uncharacterized protein n=1 Tax=Brachypodium distachyon TaxID=15368 RepID=I1I0K9_BRADI|nr:uncharacterized protein LOC112271436 [Brachypodium distachyon]KQJ94911.1 hypothetical protein BRADI_3g14010v3 [Brachypodium distachyon]|eukprot:XP_024316265.1 uncharacterized protein LOC112271436 [Brachypodium distachyon]